MTASGPSQMGALMEPFAALEDPRVERARVHSLLAMVTSALCGVIGGAESWGEIAECGRAKADWFASFLDLPTGIPSHDTLGRVFAQLDAAQFEACFAEWMPAEWMPAVAAVLPVVPLDVQEGVALDGKTLRRSHDRRGTGKATRQLVSAWATANQLVLAQVAVDEQSTAITAFPRLLQQLARTGCLVTIDAMGCQTAIAEPVREQEADSVLALKENQEHLDEEVVASFTRARASGFAEFPADAWSHWRQVGQGHGRLEIRDHWGDRRIRPCWPL